MTELAQKASLNSYSLFLMTNDVLAYLALSFEPFQSASSPRENQMLKTINTTPVDQGFNQCKESNARILVIAFKLL